MTRPTPDAGTRIVTVDLDRPSHQQAVLDLLDMYSREAGIAGRPLEDDVRGRLIDGLRQQRGGRHFLALLGEDPVGLAICFLGFSTFRARPLLNIHDLAVRPEARGRGIGRALLDAVQEAACREGCCRLTLEVRADNVIARGLYRKFGFEPGDPRTTAHWFWAKSLEEGMAATKARIHE